MYSLLKSVAVVTTVVILSVGSLEARGGGFGQGQEAGVQSSKGHKGQKGHGVLRFVNQLELTTEQQEQIQALVEVAKENKEAYNEENPKKDLYVSALSENGFDTAIYITDATERFNTTIAMQAELLAAVIEVLTAEQRVQLEELIVAEPAVSEAISYARKRLGQ